jgi:hypothetical protein
LAYIYRVINTACGKGENLTPEFRCMVVSAEDPESAKRIHPQSLVLTRDAKLLFQWSEQDKKWHIGAWRSKNDTRDKESERKLWAREHLLNLAWPFDKLVVQELGPANASIPTDKVLCVEI